MDKEFCEENFEMLSKYVLSQSDDNFLEEFDINSVDELVTLNGNKFSNEMFDKNFQEYYNKHKTIIPSSTSLDSEDRPDFDDIAKAFYQFDHESSSLLSNTSLCLGRSQQNINQHQNKIKFTNNKKLISSSSMINLNSSDFDATIKLKRTPTNNNIFKVPQLRKDYYHQQNHNQQIQSTSQQNLLKQKDETLTNSKLFNFNNSTESIFNTSLQIIKLEKTLSLKEIYKNFNEFKSLYRKIQKRLMNNDNKKPKPLSVINNLNSISEEYSKNYEQMQKFYHDLKKLLPNEDFKCDDALTNEEENILHKINNTMGCYIEILKNQKIHENLPSINDPNIDFYMETYNELLDEMPLHYFK